jgi:hypothetical protein
MLYNQPYGVTDTNAPYINGDPSIGQQGSIPPAASIEYPQREIVNFITDSGITPTNSDLTQLAKSVQNGAIKYGVATGPAYAIAVDLPIAPDAYTAGLVIAVKIATSNYGPTTIDVNSKGTVNIVRPGGQALAANDLVTGEIAYLVYDGTNFQKIGLASKALTGPQDYWVSVATGSDSNDGLSSSTPFLTIQHAVDVASTWDLNGNTLTIHVMDGTYAGGPIYLTTNSGAGLIKLLGNNITPANCLIYNNTTGMCFWVSNGGNWEISGFSFRTTATAPGAPGHCIRCLGAGTQLLVHYCSFGNCVESHLSVEFGAAATIQDSITITGSTKYHLASSAAASLLVQAAGAGTTLTISTPMNVAGANWYATANGVINGSYAAINNFSSLVGKKYDCSLNGVANSNGMGAAGLPGTVPGTTETGGQFV